MLPDFVGVIWLAVSAAACLLFVYCMLLIIRQRRIERDERDPLRPRCTKCGYSLRGLTVTRCPECGTEF